MISVYCPTHGEIASVTSQEAAVAAARLHKCGWVHIGKILLEEGTHD